MAKTLDDRKLVIEQKLEKLRLQAKLIKNREERKKATRFTAVGKLAFQADIVDLPDDVLLGAFLEIKEKSINENTINAWREKSVEKQQSNKSKEGTPITVSFSNTPSKETRKLMKNQEFKWNSFRQEYYGYGNIESMKKTLTDVECKIEVVR